MCELQTDHHKSRGPTASTGWEAVLGGGKGHLSCLRAARSKKGNHPAKGNCRGGGGRQNGSAGEAKSEWVWQRSQKGEVDRTGQPETFESLEDSVSPLRNEHPGKTYLCRRSLHHLALCGPCGEQGFPCSENHRVLRSMWLSWYAARGHR